MVEWDGQHRHTHRYMQQEGFRRHTSERVYRESTGVPGRFRRTILWYLEHMDRNVPGHPDPLTLDRTIDRLTDRWVRTLASGQEQSMVRSFVNRNRQDLRNAVLGTEEERGAFRRDAIKAIKEEDDGYPCRSSMTPPILVTGVYRRPGSQASRSRLRSPCP
ncbi:hypothetical protein [Methanoculleus sp.]|uniref:hypothetical protein n=1 Tax=Methanoculleus sp. TaxID=90427 RepID=UPI002FC7D9E5